MWGLVRGFLKGLGEIWKVAPKSTAEDDDAMFCFVYLCWTENMAQTLWNLQKSKLKTLTEDWLKSMKSKISKYCLWGIEENK